ncbi:MAG TPA: hypothetical protein VMW05_04385 [Methyloceanibacter sp.]|nr:hypothetical protein [Methyloceanibacter sp.]
MTPKRKPVASEAHEETPSLPQLCSEAADHVARARVALYDESLDADQALAHLDDAIACLQRLWTHGRTSIDGARPAARSA